MNPASAPPRCFWPFERAGTVLHMRVCGLILMAALACGCGSTEPAASPPPQSKFEEATILVSAASSLTDVLTEIGKDFEEQYPDLKVEFNFASSGALLKQIEQ